jgi:hypothetical protein
VYAVHLPCPSASLGRCISKAVESAGIPLGSKGEKPEFDPFFQASATRNVFPLLDESSWSRRRPQPWQKSLAARLQNVPLLWRNLAHLANRISPSCYLKTLSWTLVSSCWIAGRMCSHSFSSTIFSFEIEEIPFYNLHIHFAINRSVSFFPSCICAVLNAL